LDMAVGADGGSEGDGRNGSRTRRENHFDDCAGYRKRAASKNLGLRMRA
jgi:hypothetical protein